jgi:hypothetical protein
MLRYTLLCAALSVSAASPAVANEEKKISETYPSARQSVPAVDPFEIDGTYAGGDPHASVFDASPLISVIAWASNVANLPATKELPAVRTIAVGTTVILQSMLPDESEEIATSYKWTQNDFTALYDDGSRTIYLPDQWTGTTAAEMSMLAHATVQHLQNVAGVTYACPQLRNAVAYDVQARWLGLFDRTMADEFGIDPDILTVSNQCIP